MKKILLSFLCCMLAVIGIQAQSTVTDVLNRAFTGVTGTSYSSWSGKKATSDAVYAGQSAGGNESIQLRTTNSNSGIVTTTSGGKVKKVTVIWNSNTSSGRTLDIYGKNTAYSSAADLYKTNSQGTKLGSIKYGSSTELVITGDYEYIGLRSNSGAMYLTEIKIEWEAASSNAPVLTSDVKTLSFKVAPGVKSEAQTVTLTAKNLTDGVAFSCSNASFAVTDKGEYTYDVVFTAPNEVGTTNGTLTFTSTGVDPVVVDLVGVATNEVVIWEEDFEDDTTPYALTYTSGGSTTKIYENDKLAGGTAPELLISKNNGVMSVNITDLKGCSGDLALTFLSNYYDRVAVSTTTAGVSVAGSNGSYTVTVPAGTTSINLTFTNTDDGNVRVDNFKLVGTPSSEQPDLSYVTVPTFNPAAGAVEAGTVVTISTNEGSTLVYTVNGGNKVTTEENTATVTINEATTIVAHAVAADGTTISEEVTAEYTIKEVLTYENIAAFVAAAPAEEAVISGTVKVTYYKGNRLYVTDATGSLLIYGVSGGDYTNGQTLTGVRGAYDLYNGLPQMKNATIPTAVAGAAVEPVVMTVAEVNALAAKDFSRYVKVVGATVEGNTISDASGDIVIYNTFDIELTEGENLEVVAVVNHYKGTMQLSPITITEGEEPGTGGDEPVAGTYELITNVNDLEVGRNIIIVGKKNDDYYTMATQNSNNRASVAVTPNADGTITPDVSTAIIVLGKEVDNYTFAVEGGYLYAASSGSNHLKTQAENDANGQWAINIAENGEATVVAQGTNTRNQMRFNTGNNPPLFSCYGSGQQPVYIYQEVVAEESYTENIESEKKYYLDLNDVWSAEDGWFAAYFVNKNTEAETWVRGEYKEDAVSGNAGVMFYLSQYNVPAAAPARAKAEAPLYTHIVFAQMNNAVDATVHENMKWENVKKQTEFITYDGSVVKDNNGNEYMIYQLQGNSGAWLTGTDLPTAIEGVAADAVDGYVVYNLNGYLVMQTRNADNLRNLEKGFYIINGKKVVLTR